MATKEQGGLTDYLMDLVRRDDPDRFLTAMFVPAERRRAVLALMAFNAELGRIRESVSETLIGRMKLQWWRDTVAAIYAGRGAPGGHPVGEALAVAVATHGLDRADIEAMLDAREADLAEDADGPAFGDVMSVERYAAETAGRLIALELQVLDADGPQTRDAARHVGTGYGLTGLLRAVLMHARDNRLYLPGEMLAAEGLSGVQDLHVQRNAHALAAMVRSLAAVAEGHLDAAAKLEVPRAAVPALLPATVARGHLRVLARARFNVADARVVRARPSVPRLLWHAWRGRI